MLSQARTKKNIETDLMGDKLGKIHMGKQDLKTMQTRKMKGLKRSRDVEDDAADDKTDVETDYGDMQDPTSPKRSRF